MTAQITDKFLYNGKEYYFIKASDKFGFNPRDYDVKPLAFITSNWRGFYCDYCIEKNVLYLENMTICGGSKKFTEQFGGYWAGRNDYGATYKHIMMGIEYSGKLLIGRDFIDKYYLHSGFQCASAYREVIELGFSNGQVFEVVNHSEYVEKHRDELYHSEIYGSDASEKGIWKLIKSIIGLGEMKYWWEQE